MTLNTPTTTRRWKAMRVGLLVVFSFAGAIGGWIVTRHDVAFLQFFEGPLIGACFGLAALSFVMGLSRIFRMGLHPTPIQLPSATEDWRSRSRRLQEETRARAGKMRRFAWVPAIALALPMAGSIAASDRQPLELLLAIPAFLLIFISFRLGASLSIRLNKPFDSLTHRDKKESPES
jgi:hypothetical protein